MDTKSLWAHVEQELNCVAWSSLMTEKHTTPLFIKSKFTDSCYYIIITDLLRVWSRFSDKKAIKCEKQMFNPQFGAPIDRILEILQEHLQDQQPKAEYSYLIEEGDVLAFTLKTKIDFYVFQWTFNCSIMEGGPIKYSSFLRDHIIMPILYTNKLLVRQMQKGATTKKTTRAMSDVSALRRSKTIVVDDKSEEEELQSPQDVIDEPWFSAFAKRSYQRYISCSSLSLPLPPPQSSLSFLDPHPPHSIQSESALSHNGNNTLQLIYTSSVEDSVETPTYSGPSTQKQQEHAPTQHAVCSDGDENYSSEYSQEKSGSSGSGKRKYDNTTEENCDDMDESPDELRRRIVIQERLEREKAKPKAKKKRFV